MAVLPPLVKRCADFNAEQPMVTSSSNDFSSDGLIKELHSQFGHPEINAAFDRKEFVTVSGYRHREIMDAMRTLVILGEEHQRDLKDDFLSLLALNFARHDLPLFLVQRDMHQALLKTDAPQDMTLEELRLPFPSMLIVLPEDHPLRDGKGECTALMLGEAPPGTYALGAERGPLKDTSICWRVFAKGISASGPLPPGGGVIPLSAVGLRTYLDEVGKSVKVYNHHADGRVEVSADDDDNLMEDVVGYAIKIICLMNSLPEEVKDLEFVKRYRQGEAQEVRTVWKPRFIGAKYRLPKEAKEVVLGGTRLSPRMHWRRGHFKRVAHGEGRVDRRRVWIRPTIVNATPG